MGVLVPVGVEMPNLQALGVGPQLWVVVAAFAFSVAMAGRASSRTAVPAACWWR
jgi:hypothetical protein